MGTQLRRPRPTAEPPYSAPTLPTTAPRGTGGDRCGASPGGHARRYRPTPTSQSALAPSVSPFAIGLGLLLHGPPHEPSERAAPEGWPAIESIDLELRLNQPPRFEATATLDLAGVRTDRKSVV